MVNDAGMIEGKEVAVFGVVAVAAGAAGFCLGRYFFPSSKSGEGCRLNYKHCLDSAKVVNIVDVEDIGQKKSYCRCWKSKTVSFRLFCSTYVKRSPYNLFTKRATNNLPRVKVSYFNDCIG